MRELNFGLIGCGHMGFDIHAPNLTSIPGCNLVAYCDLDQSQADRALASFGGRYATTQAQRLFEDDALDGVLIQTGEAAHPTLVAGAMAAHKHVFCEKPIARDLAAAVEVTAAVHRAEREGLKFQFGTCNRYAPNVVRAKKLLPDPLFTFCQCTGKVSEQFCHNVDLAMHVFHEAPVVSVYAVGGHHYGYDPHLGADSFTSIITFADGSSHTNIQHGKAHNPALSKYHFQLFGENSCVYLAERFKQCEYSVDGQVKGNWRFVGPDVIHGDMEYMGHKAELEDWVACIRSGQGRPQLTIDGALGILAVEQAVFESIRTGAAVDFAQFWSDHVEAAPVTAVP